MSLNKQSSLKKNYLYNLSYQLLTIIVPLITTPYVSRVLGADGIGAYSYTTSIVTYFTMFGTLGIATYGQLKIAAERNNKEHISYLFWEIVIARFITMGISCICFICFSFFSKKYNILYILLISNIIAVSLDISWFLQGLEEFKKTVIRNYIIKITSVILIFIFIKNKSDLYKYILVINGSTLIGNLSLWIYVKQYIQKIDIKKLKIKKHWKQSIYYFIPTIATSVYTILDKSMIGWITNTTSQNGYYEQAHKIEQIVATFVTSLSVVTLPRMTFLYKEKHYEEINQLLKQTITFILALSMPMSFGLIAISNNLIPWFLGNGYSKCIPLLRIFSLLIVFVGMNNTIGKQCLMSTGKQKKYNNGVIVGSIVNFILNLILIPRYASIGAAISSVISEFIILSVFLYYSKDLIKVKSILKTSIEYIISSLIMSILVYFIGLNKMYSKMIVLIFQVLVGSFAYFIILVLIFRDKFIINFINKYIKNEKK